MTPERIKQFVDTDSQSIAGWFFPDDMLTFYFLDAIQKHLGVTGDLCEVGVYEGKSLVLESLMAAEGERVIGYDLFPDDLEGRTQANLGAHGNAEVCRLIAADTATIAQTAVAEALPEGVRWLHVDAGHEYHEVFHQLILFAPFVRPDGVIVMDDYQDREFPGIEAAVLDFCAIDAPRRFAPFFCGGNKLYLCAPHMAARYQRRLLAAEVFLDKCRVTKVRDDVVVVGFSKLPMRRAACEARLVDLPAPSDPGAGPFVYAHDLGALAARAAAFGQNAFGSG